MARRAKPWFRKDRKAWFVTINGQRHNLGDRKKDAHDRYHELMNAKGAVTTTDTVWSVLDAFLEWTETHRPASYDWYRAKLQLFKDNLSNRRITDLQPTDIENWLGKNKDWSDAYKAGIVTAIKRAFNWATKKAGLKHNPVTGLEKPTPSRRERVLSAAEYQAIQALATGPFRNLLTIAWGTGARPEELVKIEARHLQSNKTVVFTKAESKGKKRARVIFLTDDCFKILSALAKEHPTGPLLTNSRGKPWTHYSVACRFGRMEAKLGFKPVLYWFRHSYIHHGLTKGKIDPVSMATLAGHTTLSMIMNTYGHLLKDSDHMRDAAKKASASLPKLKFTAGVSKKPVG